MTVDNCSKMPNMVFSSESCGNKYYVNQYTNEVHCACGVEADFPHTCEAEPEKKIKSDENEELKNITGALMNFGFYGEIESIVESIKSIESQVIECLKVQNIPFNEENEKEVLLSSIIRAIEMRIKKGDSN